jgi:anti-sigma-K factor RskA
VYHPLQGGHVYPSQVPGFEQRLADLEAQIDRLSVTLHHWRETQDHLQPMERRLSHLTEQCAEILEQWTATGERHAHAVGELEARLTGWSDVETRLQREASSRFQALERVMEHEWSFLRHLHEEPAKQLQAQADSLTERCVAAAARFSGQLLWSRSRGAVFTASRMPPPSAGNTYQIWLRTAVDPVSLGTFSPDASGRVTVATDTAPSVPRPVTGVTVTLEPAPGQPAPSGPVVLARAVPVVQ